MRRIVAALLVAGLAAGLVGCTGGTAERGTAGKLAIRVNCGDPKEYTDAAGVKWLPDQEYSAAAKFGAVGGKTIVREGLTVAGTKSPEVYQTEHYAMSAYRFDVPDGKYTVRLHFAETFNGVQAAGGRTFSVKIQGKEAIKDLDVFKEAGGFAKPLVREFKGVQAADGKLMIEFVAGVQSPEINGIEVLAE
jgi:hypothetical protein